MERGTNHPERRRLPGRRLTDRQAAVLDLVASGLENKEIAHRLGISEQAVKEQVSTLLRVLEAPNRAALAGAAATRRFAGSFDIDPDWLRFLFADAPLYIAVFSGPDHRFVAANDAFRETSAGRELIGRAHAKVFPERHEVRALLDEAYRTSERVVRTDVPRRVTSAAGADVEQGYVSVVAQPLPGADGKTAGVALFSIDVTESVGARRRVAELEREQLALLDLLGAGVIVIDERGYLVRANEAARLLVSIPGGTPRLTPESVSAYAPRDASDGRPIAFEEIPTVRAMRGEACRDSIVYRVHDPGLGRDRLLRVSAMPLLHANGSRRGSVTTLSEA